MEGRRETPEMRRADRVTSQATYWSSTSWSATARFGAAPRSPKSAAFGAMTRPSFTRTADRESDQWPWVTEVKVLHDTSLRRAPTLDDIGVRSESVRQQGHIVLSEEHFLAARRHIATSRPA
jgi:hypothetical protein